jgi:hypothetical protein
LKDGRIEKLESDGRKERERERRQRERERERDWQRRKQGS